MPIVYKSTERPRWANPSAQIAGTAADNNMQVNRINVFAIGLLQKDQAPRGRHCAAEGAEARPYESVHAEQPGIRARERRRTGAGLQVLLAGRCTASDTPIVVTMKQRGAVRPSANRVANA